MPDLFTIPKGDLSLYYLGQIFGMVGTILPVNDPIIFLSGLFKVINTIALTVGAFVLVYITVVGLLATAHEGEFLGKKWNGLWVPIRTVLGVASLFPASTGYSAIQVVVMWIIVQGVGAADMLWNAAVGYTINVGSPYSSVGVSTITTAPTIQTLFQGLVCQETAAVSGVVIPSKNSGIEYYNKGYKPNYTLTTGATSYQMGPNSGSCGTLNYCDKTKDCATPDTPACWACEAQSEILPQILTFLIPFAQQYVKTDTDYVVFSEIGGKAPGWILDYCKANSVSEAACCRITPPNSSTTCATGIWKKDFDPDNPSNGYKVTSG